MPRSKAPALTERDLEILRESVKYAEWPPNRDEAPPEDRDVARTALTRKLLTFLKMPRRCREPVCRRRNVCAGLTMRCQRDFPPPKCSPEQEAAMRAATYKAIQRRLAEFKREPS